MTYQVTDDEGKTYQLTGERGTCRLDGEEIETTVIVKADKEIQKFIGEAVFRLVGICSIKGYTFEKTGQ